MTNKESIQLDPFDRALLAQLVSDARLGHLELARRLRRSPRSVRRRRLRLEQAGVLLGYGARVAEGVFGPELHAFVQLALRSRGEVANEFEQVVSDWPEIRAVHAIAGQHDYMIHVVVADTDELVEFLTARLSRLAGVHSIRTNICTKRVR